MAAPVVEASADPAQELEELLALVYQVPVGIVRFTRDGAIQLANPQVPRLLMPLFVGCAEPDNLYALLRPAVPDLESLVRAHGAPTGAVCENRRVFVGSMAPGGDPLWCALTVARLGPDRYVATLADVSRQVLQERRMRVTDAWFAAILEGAQGYAYCMIDRQGCIQGWNASLGRLLGWGRAEAEGLPAGALFPDGDGDDIRGRLHAALQHGWDLAGGWLQRNDGTRVQGDSLISVLDGELGQERFLMVARSLPGGPASADDLVRLATTDHLTGVLSRARFFELAGAQLARSAQRGEPAALLAVVLDGFKAVNDRFGNAAGDAVLRALADTCRARLRNLDIVARVGGEAFVALLPGCGPGMAHALAEGLRDAVATLRVPVPGGEVQATVSVGLVQVAEGEGAEAALRRADALLHAAGPGGDRVVAGRA